MMDLVSPNTDSLSDAAYVIGIDAGGTHTRCALATLDGTVVGAGKGPGANPNSGGDPETALFTALREATDGIDPTCVIGGVFGIAGAGAAGRPTLVSASQKAWSALGMSGEPEVFTDIAINFASGTPAATGIVVFAGTGAGAAVIQDGEIIRRADGYGYLLGDEGSAVWIGREGVKAALSAMDGRGTPTILSDLVPRALLGAAVMAELSPRHLVLAGSGHDLPVGPSLLPQAILKEVYGKPPATLGRIGPVVSAAAETGDPVATRIVQEAADWLLMDVDAVRPALTDPCAPVVLAGSVLTGGPVAEIVRTGLEARFGTAPALAGDGAAGAARMAIRRLVAA
ncbi:N-acetylglucosamine kinase [Actinocorallia longicatena]|uniref:BadF/BadG/BcrA/BcrD ATPase family protein n=1 Tax=Actinocorallia longicatena TaxID=111803 RepID=A0ABP6QM78_9ACTN